MEQDLVGHRTGAPIEVGQIGLRDTQVGRCVLLQGEAIHPAAKERERLFVSHAGKISELENGCQGESDGCENNIEVWLVMRMAHG